MSSFVFYGKWVIAVVVDGDDYALLKRVRRFKQLLLGVARLPNMREREKYSNCKNSFDHREVGNTPDVFICLPKLSQNAFVPKSSFGKNGLLLSNQFHFVCALRFVFLHLSRLHLLEMR